jgi:galactose oxidase
MRRKARGIRAAWRAVIVGVLLGACSVYDMPPGSLKNEQESRSSGGDNGEGSTGGLPSNGGTSGSSAAAPATGGTSDSLGGGSPAAGGSTGQTSGGIGASAGSSTVPDTGGAPVDADVGGMASSGGDTGDGGAGPFPANMVRYVKLVALTEQNNHVWTSVAELQVLTTGSKPLDRSGWSIKADSEETTVENAPAKYAIDGQSTSYWHTAWSWDSTVDTPLPHYLIVDLGAPQVVTGFTYLPRQDKTNGNIEDWAFYLSSDGNDWGNPVKSGSFASGSALKTVTFSF